MLKITNIVPSMNATTRIWANVTCRVAMVTPNDPSASTRTTSAQIISHFRLNRSDATPAGRANNA